MQKVILFLAISLLFSCSSETNKEVKTTPISPPIKLHVFSGGKIVVNNLELFSQDTTYHGQTKTLADAFYVIEHPKGNLMWDAGLPENLVGQEPFTDPSGAFTVSREDSLVNQLKSIGLTIADFKYFAMSHTHFDHIGHANSMKDATWIVQENEYEFFRNEEVKKQHPELAGGIKDLKNPKKIIGDYDIFGDGKVVIKYAPGHTIGHQTLYLDIGLERPLILVGDLYHFQENRDHKRVPIFNHSVENTLSSMDSIENFAKAKGADIIIQHSQKDFDRLQKMLNAK